MPKKSSPRKTPTVAQQSLAVLESLASLRTFLTAEEANYPEDRRIDESLKLYIANKLYEVHAVLFAAAKGDRKAIREVQARFPIAPGRGRYRERTEDERRAQDRTRQRKRYKRTAAFKAEVQRELEKIIETIRQAGLKIPRQIRWDHSALSLAKVEIRERVIGAAAKSTSLAIQQAAEHAKILQMKDFLP